MTKASRILGLNARQMLFKSLNSSKARNRANSKLLTKKFLKELDVPVPELFKVFTSGEQINEFDFDQINSSFVIKPSGGSGGKGILIVRKALKQPGKWMGVDGDVLETRDLQLHISDILEGQYSTVGSRSSAFVEERVPRHPKFKKYVYRGTPDIRVVVYNRVPVMAMLRLPTKESGGRANLHQGAIGVGVDIATGVTLKGVKNGKKVRFYPGTKKKLNGLKIPKWTSVLQTAVSAMDAIGLVYGGVDILIHKDKGPMVIELNASPGLGIQLANDAGLRWRMERVEGLKVRNVDHGVRVGKALFAESFADKVKADEGLVIVDNFENVQVRSVDKKKVDVEAIIDSGAYRSAIDREVAEKLGLLSEENILFERNYVSTLGRKKRLIVEATFYLKGRRIKSAVSVANRNDRVTKMLIGRLDLQGFMINPQLRKR